MRGWSPVYRATVFAARRSSQVTLLKQEGTVLRDETSKLSVERYRLEKELSSREAAVSAAQQAAHDKEALLAKATSLHEAAADAKRQLDVSLADVKENNAKLQQKLRISSTEITKGNAIIHKLQNDGRALKSKLRLKAALMLQQQVTWDCYCPMLTPPDENALHVALLSCSNPFM